MPPNPADSVLADRIAARVAERGIGGLVWALARGDDVTAHALGWRDPVGETTPMTVDTLFRVASVTKPIVGALAMRLWESGVIGPDEPISTWLPELADVRVLRDADGPWDGPTGPLRRPITVRDVLELRTGWGMAFGQDPSPHLLRLWDLGIGPGVTTALATCGTRPTGGGRDAPRCSPPDPGWSRRLPISWPSDACSPVAGPFAGRGCSRKTP